MSETYDIAIAGAGPAGSSLALRLASAGKRVVLIEKEKFPRDKLCGEFISPECLSHFAELGVLDDMRTSGGVDLNETVFYGHSGRGVAVPSAMFGGPCSHALGLSRAEMDLRLIERAREMGVEVLDETTVSDLIYDGDRIAGMLLKARRSASSLRASVVVDASGRTRALGRKVERKTAVRAKFVAFKAHVRGVDVEEDRCEIFSYQSGYGGISRIERGLHNLCFITRAAHVKRLGNDPMKVLREIVCSNKRAAQVFRHVELASEWLAVPIERFGRSTLSPAKGLLTIGDAAAFIDPFTGSGILLALESSRLASESILATPDIEKLAGEYETRYRAVFDPRLRVCSLLRRASGTPLLAEIVIFGLGLSSTVRGKLVRSTRMARTRKFVDT